MLPIHGPIACNKCFNGNTDRYGQLGNWKLQNDPCHWGSASPKYLVLGFSKGFTQAMEFDSGKFEDVPFKGMRPRLARILRAFDLMANESSIDELFGNKDSDIAFASLVRCSVSRLDEKKSALTGRSVYGCTGPIITKSFKEIPHVIDNCAGSFLTELPRSLKTIVFLGNGDAYIKNTMALVKKYYGEDFSLVNDCAVRAGGKLWVWVAHPSGLNGHFENWISGIGKPGNKFQQVMSALNNNNQKYQV